jgi:hypothetical protein
MISCQLESTDLRELAEQGLSSFLLAVGEGASDEEILRTGDCWIRAFESTHWSPAQRPERFIGRVTIKALAIRAGQCD